MSMSSYIKILTGTVAVAVPLGYLLHKIYSNDEDFEISKSRNDITEETVDSEPESEPEIPESRNFDDESIDAVF